MAQAPDPIRHVTAQTRIYLPGGSHGFRPGETVPLSESVHADLVAAGHLDPPEPAAPAAEPSAPPDGQEQPDAPAADPEQPSPSTPGAG